MIFILRENFKVGFKDNFFIQQEINYVLKSVGVYCIVVIILVILHGILESLISKQRYNTIEFYYYSLVSLAAQILLFSVCYFHTQWVINQFHEYFGDEQADAFEMTVHLVKARIRSTSADIESKNGRGRQGGNNKRYVIHLKRSIPNTFKASSTSTTLMSARSASVTNTDDSGTSMKSKTDTDTNNSVMETATTAITTSTATSNINGATLAKSQTSSFEIDAATNVHADGLQLSLNHYGNISVETDSKTCMSSPSPILSNFNSQISITNDGECNNNIANNNTNLHSTGQIRNQTNDGKGEKTEKSEKSLKTSDNSNSCRNVFTLHDCLKNEVTFDLFVSHLSKEYSLDLLLAFIEFCQWKQLIYNMFKHKITCRILLGTYTQPYMPF